MAPSVSLSVPFEPQRSRAQKSLASKVGQIISQRGAFRNLSERSLQGEANGSIENLEDESKKKMEVDGDSDAEETVEARTDRLWKSKNEMLQRLDYAQNEILSALDFVSLLLSNHSEAAKASMSTPLKDAAPFGSIDMRKVTGKEPSESRKRLLNHVAWSWKADRFDSASKKLNESSGRLQKEAALQSKYWEQIAVLKTQGWSVSRLPDDARAIVVHFGFAEATPQFSNRGFAILKQDDEGNLQISQPSSSHSTKRIRIYVMRHGEQTGKSSDHLLEHNEGTYIQKQLINARDALFDEELFYEIGREARLIANHGVALRSNSVEIKISNNFSIRIVQDGVQNYSQESENANDNALSNFVAVSLRILLVGEHEKSYLRRSFQKPLPISQAPKPNPEYALLRPLIAQLRHQAVVSEISRRSWIYQQALSSAGLNFTSAQQQTQNGQNQEVDISSLRDPAKTSITINLPSKKEMHVVLETYLASPLYGTQIRANSLKYTFVTLDLAPTHSLVEFEAFLQHVISMDMVHTVIETQVNDGKWIALRPQSGELVLLRSQEKVAKLRLKFSTAGLSVITVRKGQEGDVALQWTSTGVWHTKRGARKEEVKKSFTQLISELSSSQT